MSWHNCPTIDDNAPKYEVSNRKKHKINFKRFWELKKFIKDCGQGNYASDILRVWNINRKYLFTITKTDILQVKKCKTYQEYRELVRNGGVVNKPTKAAKYKTADLIYYDVIKGIDRAVQGLTPEEKLKRALSNLGDAIIELTNKQK